MADSVPVRCPACRREHAFTPRSFPCACGAPLTVPLLRGGVPTEVRQRSWRGSWVRVRCGACGRTDDWPSPEVGCDCGAVIRLATDPTGGTGSPAVPGPAPAPVPRPVRRPAFEPRPIRTGQDAVTAAARYLSWLGYASVVPTAGRETSGADLRGDGLLARVEPSTRPVSVRDVETLWLACLHGEVAGAHFALAGYDPLAAERADELAVPLFALDLTGTPRPLNEAAHTLIRTAPGR
jgi:ribosomal protein S27E